MSLRARAKRALFDVLRWRWLNHIVVFLVKPLSHVFPIANLRRIPAVRTFEVRGPDSRGLKLDSDGRDSIANRVFWCGLDDFEPESIKLFLRLAERSSVIFDVGANSGIYVLLAARANSAARVYAFEPVAEVFECLQRNIRVNQLSNITAERVALSDHAGAVDFFIPDSATLPTSASYAAGFRVSGRTVKVPLATIDEYVHEHGIKSVDLIKIDTETTEPQVLAGARNTVTNFRPWILCEVLKGRTERALQAILDGQDYEFYLVTDSELVQNRVIEGDAAHRFNNYLFAPRERMSTLQVDIGKVVRSRP